MKTLFPFLFIALLSCSAGDTSEAGTDKAGTTKPRILRETSVTYYSEGGRMASDKKDTLELKIVTYNDSGKVAEINSTWLKKQTIKKYSYVYDRNGNLAEWSFTDNLSSVPSRWVMEYDTNGRKIKERTLRAAGGWIIETTYTYDAAGDLVTEVNAFDDSPRKFTSVYTYDANHNQTSLKYYDDDKLSSHYVYTYNDKNKMTEQKIMDASGFVQSKLVFTYNKELLPVKVETWHATAPDKMELIESLLYQYDQYGNAIQYETQNKSPGMNRYTVVTIEYEKKK